MGTTKTVKIWLCINRDGRISMHAEEPTRNADHGTWTSKSPYCNASLLKEMEDLVEKSGLTWASEPEMFEITFKKVDRDG